MAENSLKRKIRDRLGTIVLVLLVVQPVMDVFSYFLGELGGSNLVSTVLRFLMLGVVAMLGFTASDRKRLYLAVYGVMAAYWLLHVLNCFRIGYLSLYQDTANYLRILTFPVFLLSFLTFFTISGEELRRRMAIGFAVNMGLSVLFTALPWGLYLLGLGQPIYTYQQLFVGVMGWFVIPNAQSCIITLLTPLSLYCAWRTQKPWFFALTCAGCFGLMFVTGTKLTYYSIFLIPAAFLFLFLVNPGRKRALPYAAVLVAVVLLCFFFRSYAPSNVREGMSGYSQGIYNQRVETALSGSGASEKVMESIRSGRVLTEQEEEEEDEDLAEEELNYSPLALARQSLYGVYTDPEVYGGIMVDLNDRFGLYNVMAMYRYSADSWSLSDLRLRKTNYASLVWEECDTLTRLLGFEYSQVLWGGHIYDLENDFPAVYYNCGWLGFGLYLLLVFYVVWQVLRAFVRDPLHFLTVEMGAVGMTFVLALGAAQISGYVLRRPNVAIYLAVASAYLCSLSGEICREHPRPKKER